MNIVKVGIGLPVKRETVAEAARRLNIPKEQSKVFERLFGLKMLPIDAKATVESLMLKAAKNCLAASGITRSQVKWVIHTHTGYPIAPFGESPVRYVQRKLNLSSALAFGTSMGKCGSVFAAIQIANELFCHLGENDAILILTGDVTFTEILQFIPGTTITTDGACAILLTNRPEQRMNFLSMKINSYGEFAGGVWNKKEIQQLFEKNYSRYLFHVILSAVRQANLTLDDIKFIFPHNVNTLSWYQVIKLLDIPSFCVFLDNVPVTGHCFGSDPFINYQTALDRGLIQAGDYVVFATVGLGATFGAMVFQY